MSATISLRMIVAEAKRKGYFALGDYPKLRLNPQEMLELMDLISKNKIPFGAPESEKIVSVKRG